LNLANVRWGRLMSFHEKSCGAVVFKRDGEVQYLLLHYEAGHWDYVKGQVESHETEKDTVTRELEEETGIANSRFVEGFREVINYFYRREGKTVYKEVVFFLIESKDSRVKLSYEHVGYEWLNYEKAMAKLTFANAKKVLAKAHEFLRKHEDTQAS
jgi:8-oxo-dGTP pyrophosphatase MutT (NUDIX family)